MAFSECFIRPRLDSLDLVLCNCTHLHFPKLQPYYSRNTDRNQFPHLIESIKKVKKILAQKNYVSIFQIIACDADRWYHRHAIKSSTRRFTMGSALETMMLVCFGFSWPLNVIKAYKAGTAKGTSLPFILLIIAGYVAGISAKIGCMSTCLFNSIPLLTSRFI